MSSRTQKGPLGRSLILKLLCPRRSKTKPLKPMKGGELMRSERTAAEFDILVAFLGCARTRFSILRYGHFKGTRSNSDRLSCRSSSSIPRQGGIGPC